MAIAQLFGGYLRWLHLQWPAGRVEKLPEVNADGTTAVPGVRVVGDLTGIPLLKFAADGGAKAIQAFAEELKKEGPAPAGVADVAIVGGGVAGIAAALEAKKLGLNAVVYEATQPFSTIANFPKAKPIFTYPTDFQPAGDLKLTAEVKEDLLGELETQRSAAGIVPQVRRVEKLERRDGVLHLHSEGMEAAKARRVVVAIGRSGNYRRLGVPGEELDKVTNRLHDPKDYAGKNVLVVGGGDSAVEAAIALAKAGAKTTLVHRSADFARAKPENVAALREHVADVRLQTQVTAVTPTTVKLKSKESGPSEIPNEAVLSLIGREAPLDFFRRSGIPIQGETRWWGWVGLAAMILFCTFIYSWKAGGPTQDWVSPAPLAEWVKSQASDRSTLLGTLGVSMQSRSFYYTLLYSSLILVFGIDRMRRRKTPYVRRQTWTLMAVQWLPLFLLPEIILPWMGYNGMFSSGFGGWVADNLFEKYIPEAAYAAGQWPDWGHPRAYWRAYGFILAWPLNVYNVFTDSPHWWWIGIGFLQTFVIIPLLIWRWGKGAYCGWICSCGALAETMGDRHRHKMFHGPLSNRWNFIGQVFLAMAFGLLALRIVGWVWPESWAAQSFHLLLEGKGADGHLWPGFIFSYKWGVDILWGGVLGVAFYFKYSGRIWCRFACPLAALMHLYARFTTFRIFADKKKCISCNVCTSVCHQGIDVMAFANKGAPMMDPECVRCSACVQSCPTGVLSFGHVGPTGVPMLDRLSASPVQAAEMAKAQMKG